MSTDIIDDRLLGALHLRVMNRAGLGHDPAIEHAAFEPGSLDTLSTDGFGGETTIGALLAQGDHGIGTTQNLGGEMIIVDGQAWVASADGRVERVPDETTTPFAVVSRFSVLAHSPLRRALGLRAIREVFDAMAPNAPGIVAVRLDGEFIDLHLRSVHPQTPPYAPLVEVTSHQTEWSVPSASGSVVGFRFPDRVAGVEVPAYHLHFVSCDRTHGGHVLDLTMAEGDLQVAGADDLHVEVPEHLGLGTPGAADRAALRQAERG